MRPKTSSLVIAVILPMLAVGSVCFASNKPALPDQARPGLEIALDNMSGEGLGQVVLEWMLDEDPSQGLVETIHESLALTVPPGSQNSSANLLTVPLFVDGDGIYSLVQGLLGEGLRGRELAQAINDHLGVGGGPGFDTPVGPDSMPPQSGRNNIPEPATLSLLGLGSLIAFRRKRR